MAARPKTRRINRARWLPPQDYVDKVAHLLQEGMEESIGACTLDNNQVQSVARYMAERLLPLIEG